MISTRILFVVFLAFAIGCKKELKTDYKNLVNAGFGGLTIQIPGVFVETDLDGLIESWNQSKVSRELVQSQVRHLETLRVLEVNFTVYVDTTEISNTIFILAGPYLKINKWTSQQFFKVLDKKIRTEAKELDAKVSPLENSFYTLKNGNDILKVKFEWSSGISKKYATQYLFNSKGSTFGIVVMDDEEDFEQLVRNAKIVNL